MVHIHTIAHDLRDVMEGVSWRGCNGGVGVLEGVREKGLLEGVIGVK